MKKSLYLATLFLLAFACKKDNPPAPLVVVQEDPNFTFSNCNTGGFPKQFDVCQLQLVKKYNSFSSSADTLIYDAQGRLRRIHGLSLSNRTLSIRYYEYVYNDACSSVELYFRKPNDADELQGEFFYKDQKLVQTLLYDVFNPTETLSTQHYAYDGDHPTFSRIKLLFFPIYIAYNTDNKGNITQMFAADSTLTILDSVNFVANSYNTQVDNPYYWLPPMPSHLMRTLRPNPNMFQSEIPADPQAESFSSWGNSRNLLDSLVHHNPGLPSTSYAYTYHCP